MSTEAQRRILETAFEPHGDGYLFYRDRWSSGIPVTAAEREEYLAILPFGSPRAFYRRIEGRAPVTGPRDPAKTRWAMIASISTSTVMMLLLAALTVLALSFANEPLLDRRLMVGSAALFVLFSLYILLAKAMLKR